MKTNWLVIGLIVIVVALIIFATVIFFFFRTPKPAPSPFNSNPFSSAIDTGSANQTVSPATFALNFYKWYIGNKTTDINFPSTEQLSTLFPQWTTQSFILTYQSERSDLNFDEDPVLYAQDDPRGWGTGFTANVLSETATASSVQVVIGSGTMTHTYTVELVKQNNQWLINSISGSN
jgi:hypothetical protein